MAAVRGFFLVAFVGMYLAVGGFGSLGLGTLHGEAYAQGETPAQDKVVTEQADSFEVAKAEAEETETSADSIFSRAWRGGFVVFTVLLSLVFMSIMTWAILVAKLVHLRKISLSSTGFVKSFWDSRSLNDLNSKLSDFPYSPVREVFRNGYAELVRASQLREQAGNIGLGVQAAMENLGRSLDKAKLLERRRMEKFLSVLAISASAAPFIGLFGTVWGIMGAFEGIAKTGSASLAAVAPGISEALIATAFGLAAAIPAVIGYNVSINKVRGLMAQIDGFGADFLNIVERYLVSDRTRSQSTGNIASPSNPEHI